MRCISHVSDLKIMASQALLLIHTHLSHFLYLRKVEAMSPGRLSRSYPCFCSQNCCYQTWGFFPHCHSTCMWPGCYEGRRFAATCATHAVCPVSPEMVLIFKAVLPDLHPCVMMQEKQVRDEPQLSSSVSPCCLLLPLPCLCRSQGTMGLSSEREKGNGTQCELVDTNLATSSNTTLMIVMPYQAS